MRKTLLLFTAILVVVVGLVYLVSRKNFLPTEPTEQESFVPVENIGTSANNDLLLKSVYADYSDASTVRDYADHGFPILFFISSSCQTCQQAIQDITANPASIPAGVKIFKVDYDAAVSLRTKYGVTAPHTWVQVNSQDTVLKKWEGGKVAELVAHFSQGN